MAGTWTEKDHNLKGIETLSEWVDGQTSNSKITMKHIKRVVGDIVGSTPEGATPDKYAGETVYHQTSFDKGPGEGCTVFYTNPDRDGTSGTIVGIGIHLGSDSYKLDYRRKGWEVDKSYTLEPPPPEKKDKKKKGKK